MSEYVDRDIQDQPFEEEFPLVDWTRLEDDALHRPWLVFGQNDWAGERESWDQAAVEQLGDRGTALAQFIGLDAPRPLSNQFQEGNHMSVHDTQLIEIGDSSISWPHTGQFHTPLKSLDPAAVPPPTELLPVAESPRFVCSHEDCDGKSFKRRSELNRHRLKHSQRRSYDCPAHGCNRSGRNGFTRADKLIDHLFRGHDQNTLFRCPAGQCQETGLTRDLLSIHLSSLSYNERWSQGLNALENLEQYRACPIPKCSFRLSARWNLGSKAMDTLSHHILTHSAKGRANVANHLLQRGYDADMGKVVCPMCSRRNQFGGHLEFYNHFLTLHCVNPTRYLTTMTEDRYSDRYGKVRDIFLNSASLAVKAYAHRRTLLSLWPGFCDYPVWDDVKCPGLVMRQEKVSSTSTSQL